MPASLEWSAYDEDGRPVRPIATGQLMLPDEMDWVPIDAKEQYLRYMGGFPQGAHTMLIKSQGEHKLVSDLGEMVAPQTYHQYKEKQDGWYSKVQDRCTQRGIDLSRDPRGQ